MPSPDCRGANVVAHLNPGDGKAILVGAHYDHLGREAPGEAYWGADDNAAAVAILLEIAGRFAGSSPGVGGAKLELVG